MTTTIQTRRLLTEVEAASRLGINPGTLTVWRSTRRYGLPYVKVGRSVRYDETDIDKFIESRTVHQVEAGI